MASKEWSDAVVAVRLELGIPSTGLPEGEALAIHKALLETELGQQPMEVRFNAQEWRPVAHFWKELISGSRRLCALLGIDPRPLDNLRESYAGGAGSTLIGVRKLLSPEGAFRFGGKELPFGPTQIDYLIGHVLWRLPLDPATMEPKPSVSYEWKRLDDDNGRFLPHVFNQKDATASERREMKMKLEGAKRSFRDVLLLTVAEGKQWRGLTWEERWRKWNGLFPDFACQTPEALQKACQYAVNNRKKIQTRFEKLTQIPSGS